MVFVGNDSNPTIGAKWRIIVSIFIILIWALYSAYVWNMHQELTVLKIDHPIIKNDTLMNTWYIDYSPELLTASLASWQTVILFFAAPWCPSCRSLDTTIQANLGSIPVDSVILRVNYDNSTELKRQYGVVTQHTTVVLNLDGSEKSKKIGARTVAEAIGKQ